MDVRMDGRKALITGGSVGLGKAMATKFAQSGADVGLIARGGERLEAAKMEIEAASGQKVFTYTCDVCDPAALTAVHTKAVGDLGQIDITVNNAGHSAVGKFEDVSDETWQYDIDLKLMAAVRLSRLVFPAMKERRWGRIINVLNIYAKAPAGGTAPTSVTRAAGMALTKVLAGEGAPHNVLVNALLVGFIDSDQWVRRHNPADGSYEDYLAAMAKQRRIPLGRVGSADEFASTACFLASDAGGYITGTALNVDGGASPVV